MTFHGMAKLAAIRTFNMYNCYIVFINQNKVLCISSAQDSEKVVMFNTTADK